MTRHALRQYLGSSSILTGLLVLGALGLVLFVGMGLRTDAESAFDPQARHIVEYTVKRLGQRALDFKEHENDMSKMVNLDNNTAFGFVPEAVGPNEALVRVYPLVQVEDASQGGRWVRPDNQEPLETIRVATYLPAYTSTIGGNNDYELTLKKITESPRKVH